MATPGEPRRLDGGGTSLANLSEIILGLLDAAAVRSVVEIGAFRGELTSVLLDWAEDHEARVAAIDPAPTRELLELTRTHPGLELIRKTSFEALDTMTMPDAVIVDGDHNYYTVTGELERVYSVRRYTGPLVMIHDVGWPLARRDTYHVPERIPGDYRQPLSPASGLSEQPSFASDRPFAYTAEREGGPRNGGLTAIEDFMSQRKDLRLAVVPAFFGLGVLWHRDAPWAAAVAEFIGPLDRHPVLERLEADRVARLIAEQMYARRVAHLEGGPGPDAGAERTS